jgi:hypothetical protein
MHFIPSFEGVNLVMDANGSVKLSSHTAPLQAQPTIAGEV